MIFPGPCTPGRLHLNPGLMAQSNALYRQAKESCEEEIMTRFRQFWNTLNQLLRNLRSRYTCNLFENRNQSSIEKLKFGSGKHVLSFYFVPSPDIGDPNHVDIYIYRRCFSTITHLNHFTSNLLRKMMYLGHWATFK